MAQMVQAEVAVIDTILVTEIIWYTNFGIGNTLNYQNSRLVG